MTEQDIFPKKRNEYIRVLLDIDPSKKEDITFELLCNILIRALRSAARR